MIAGRSQQLLWFPTATNKITVFHVFAMQSIMYCKSMCVCSYSATDLSDLQNFRHAYAFSSTATEQCRYSCTHLKNHTCRAQCCICYSRTCVYGINDLQVLVQGDMHCQQEWDMSSMTSVRKCTQLIPLDRNWVILVSD